MSKKISNKIKSIREAEKLSQPLFSKKINISISTLKKYEGGHNEPGGEALIKICTAFPHYMWYLMQESMDGAPDGQIAPEEKILRDLSIREREA